MNKVQPFWRLNLIMALVLLLGAGGMAAPGAPGDAGLDEYQARAARPSDLQQAAHRVSALPAPDVEVLVDGSRMQLDEPVRIQDGRTLVPMRELFTALGAEVSWDEANRVAIGTRDGVEVRIPIGSTQPTVDGETVNIDAMAQIINGRTYIPLRFVGEALGDEVKWDGAAREILITTDRDREDPENGDDEDENLVTVTGYVLRAIPGTRTREPREICFSREHPAMVIIGKELDYDLRRTSHRLQIRDRVADVQTGEDGAWEADIPPGTYQIFYWSGPGVMTWGEVQRTIYYAPNIHRGVEITAPREDLGGTTLQESDHPAHRKSLVRLAWDD